MCTPISRSIGPKANISVFIFHLEFVLFYIFLGSNFLFIDSVLVVYMFFDIFPYLIKLFNLLAYSSSWYPLAIFCISVISVVTSPLSFLILFIWNCLFSL